MPYLRPRWRRAARQAPDELDEIARHAVERLAEVTASSSSAVALAMAARSVSEFATPLVVAGAYPPETGVDFIVRGEGEVTFRELLRAIENGCGYEHIAGLSAFRTATARPSCTTRIGW